MIFLEVDNLKDKRTVSNPWSMAKDGTVHYIGDLKDHVDYKKWLRK